MRLCVGCGGRSPQAAMVRIALGPDGVLRPLTRKGHGGRTAYLHPCPACWEQFAARKGPVRSLGRRVDRAARHALVEGLRKAEHFAKLG